MRRILEQLLRRQKTPVWLVIRVQIIVKALARQSNSAIAQEMGLDRNTARTWRERWHESSLQREMAERETVEDKALEAFIIESLSDHYRSGTPPTFSAEQMVQIIAIACEEPQASGYPMSHWSPKEIAAEAVQRGLVTSISERQVGRFLKRGRLKTAPESLLAQHQGNQSGKIPERG